MKLQSRLFYSYKSNQSIKGTKSLNLVSNSLNLRSDRFLNQNTNIEIVPNSKTVEIDFRISEKLQLNNYILPNLRYKNIESCFLTQPNQFLDGYTILGYLETTVLNSLEIVKFKVKNKDTKKIFLIRFWYIVLAY